MPSFGITRRYGRRRMATSTDTIVLANEPVLSTQTEEGGSWQTLKTFTLTQNQIKTKSYIVKMLLVTCDCNDGSGGGATLRVSFNGVFVPSSDGQALGVASANRATFYFSHAITNFNNTMTILIQAKNYTNLELLNSKVEGVIQVVI